MSQPRVSVIIPTHNRAALLPVAVESARRAGGEPEIVVVDDASTDATPQVCRSLAGIRLVRLEKNVGLAAARNAGIHASTGEFIALLDDDDQRLPDSLPPQLEALQDNPEAAFCYGQILLGENATGRWTGEVLPEKIFRGDIFWRLLRGNFIPGLTVVLRREALLAAGLFDPRLRQVEDWDLWLRLAQFHP
ncbi:MAG: glycosyltransferase, partial [Verrucomicrobiota bacterium]|nr:glycosyltransferase [Verrucomicrobiota bacterium]